MGIRAYALVGFFIISLLFTQYAFAQVTSCPDPDDIIVDGVCVSAFGDEPSGSAISVKTDRSSYNDGDTIRIAGNVGTIIQSDVPIPVTILIVDFTGNIVSMFQVMPNSAGDYSHSIIAGGTMEDSGDYEVIAQYGYQKASTTFYFESVSATESQIFISTDKSTYDHSSTIFVNGKVTNPISGTLVTLIVISPINDIVTIDQLSIDTYGNFNTFLSTTGNLWKYDGVYTIKVQYHGGEAVDNKVLVELTDGTTPTPASKFFSSNPRIVDAFGNLLHSVSVGQQIHITADLENQNNFDQIFVYYIKVRETGDEFWITGSLSPRQSFSPALFWTPKIAGTHTLDITIFDDMQRQNVLAPTLTISQVVVGTTAFSGCGPNEVRDITGKCVSAFDVEPSGGTLSVETDRSSYNDGDTIRITGSISSLNENYPVPVTILIVDSTGEIISISQVYPSSDGSFSHSITAGGIMISGDYEIRAQYGAQKSSTIFSFSADGSTPTPTPFDTTPPLILTPSDMTIDATDSSGARVYYSVKAIDDNDGVLKPRCSPSSGAFFKIGNTGVTCLATDNSGNSARKSFLITVNSPDVVIPSWIRNVAGFWCDDEINDSSFIEAIEYLIDNDVIIVPTTVSSGSGVQEIPNWIKSNACWWSQGLISNSDFAGGLQYLIGQGIIRV
ncbi:MAG: HYR domain-containing protein [Thaumarchaeota archaeon]|nr:HYR domain-containing protein [Nitrososphaerota archaeon]